MEERYRITIIQRMNGQWTASISGPHTHMEALGLLEIVKQLIGKEAIKAALPNMQEGLRVS